MTRPAPLALVTGATSGIGRATAFALGRAGWRVGVTARTPANVSALVAALEQEGIAAVGTAADVADPADVARWVAACTARFGAPIAALVNNAGLLVAKRIDALSLDEFDAVQRVNVRALFVTVQAALPGLRVHGAGATIVNVASLAARNGFVGGTAYTASKHAALGFGRSLMLELRPEGVRVVTLCPGSVDTPMLADQPLLPTRPERILTPDDVAETVRWCLTVPARALVSELDLRPTTP